MGPEFTIWILFSLILNYILKKKFTFFKVFGTPKKLFLLSLIFFLIHQITTSFLRTPEFIFFLFFLLSFGLFLISFFEERGEVKENIFIENKRDFERNIKERARIKHIASQSQLYRLEKKENSSQKFYKS